MKNRLMFIIYVIIIINLLLNGCKKNDPTEPPVTNEHPPATTVTLFLIKYDQSGNLTKDTTKVTIRDTTVIKGKPAIEGILNLISGSSYKGFITLLNESVSPVEDMTEDIIVEKDGHSFIYSMKGGVISRIIISELDKDSMGKEFGLNFKAAVTGTGSASGYINIILRHYDSMNKSDSVFDTDMDSDFPVIIK